MIARLTKEIQAVEILKKKLINEAKTRLKCDTMPLVDFKFINEGRYAILRYKHDQKHIKFFITFKKEHFHSFAKIFPNESGEGESINIYHLKRYCFDLNNEPSVDKIIYVIEKSTGTKYYYITPMQLTKLAEKGKAYEYKNGSDGMNQLIFSVKFLSEL